MQNAIKTKHNLDFESRPWLGEIQEFQIGTCTGQWFPMGKSYCILSVVNSEMGNGHLDDVFEWFEYSCKRDGYSLKVLSVMNKRFEKHLKEKRGFVGIGEDNYEKKFS